jgi:hypothetical protein
MIFYPIVYGKHTIIHLPRERDLLRADLKVRKRLYGVYGKAREYYVTPDHRFIDRRTGEKLAEISIVKE